jgi:hypothetical protein
MAARASLGIAELLGKTLGPVFSFALFDRNVRRRWVKRGIVAGLLLLAAGYLSRELAGGLMTILVVSGAVLAISKGRALPRSEGTWSWPASSEPDETEAADNDPYSQRNIHNPLFHESDFNSPDKG